MRRISVAWYTDNLPLHPLSGLANKVSSWRCLINLFFRYDISTSVFFLIVITSSNTRAADSLSVSSCRHWSRILYFTTVIRDCTMHIGMSERSSSITSISMLRVLSVEWFWRIKTFLICSWRCADRTWWNICFRGNVIFTDQTDAT